MVISMISMCVRHFGSIQLSQIQVKHPVAFCLVLPSCGSLPHHHHHHHHHYSGWTFMVSDQSHITLRVVELHYR